MQLSGRPDITERILTELDLTQRAVLDVLEQSTLLERKRVLRSAVELRAPYVDSLSQLQLRALTELRSARATTDPSPGPSSSGIGCCC